MDHKSLLLISSFIVGSSSSLYANDISFSENTDAPLLNESEYTEQAKLKDLKNVRLKNLKVDANAAQPDAVKDPLEPLNRKIFHLNSTVDRHVVRPVAVQYQEKVPDDVRGSYSSFRRNLTEPWSAVNQLFQGQPLRALKTLSRFTLNTVTTLGFADPAQHLGLNTQSDGFANTLGYYGVPSGPYLVLPIFGPSTLRDSVGLAVDTVGRPQEYLDGQDALYWSDQVGRGISARASVLDLENTIQSDDQYAAMRDIYLQRRNFVIAERRGSEANAIQFIDDVSDEEIDNSESNPSK